MNFMARFAQVQSCIVNHDKRHAFLKLITHQDAIAAKTAVEQLPEPEYRAMFERVSLTFSFLLTMELTMSRSIGLSDSGQLNMRTIT